MLDDAVRLVAGLDEPDEQNYVRAARAGRPRGARRRAPGDHPDLRLQARRLRRRAAAADRRAELARRRRPGRGLRGLGRLRLRPRPGRPGGPGRHGDRLPADRGRRAQHRHARARHRRLRRLLPVPRRHDRHRPGADRPRAARLHRRLHPPRHRPHAVAGRGDGAGVPRPGRQPALDRGDEAGTATRGRSSWPPRSTTCSATTPRPAWSRTGCTSRLTQVYVLDRAMREFFARSNPWALHGIAERLLEAADRKLWDNPDPQTLAALPPGLPGNRGRPGGPLTRDRAGTRYRLFSPAPRGLTGVTARDIWDMGAEQIDFFVSHAGRVRPRPARRGTPRSPGRQRQAPGTGPGLVSRLATVTTVSTCAPSTDTGSGRPTPPAMTRRHNSLDSCPSWPPPSAGCGARNVGTAGRPSSTRLSPRPPSASTCGSGPCPTPCGGGGNRVGSSLPVCMG